MKRNAIILLGLFFLSACSGPDRELQPLEEFQETTVETVRPQSLDPSELSKHPQRSPQEALEIAQQTIGVMKWYACVTY